MPPPPSPIIVRDSRARLAGHLRDWVLDAVSGGRGSLLGLAVGASTLPLYRSLPVDDATEQLRILPIDELVPAPADPERTFFARLRAALPRRLAARVTRLPQDPAELDALVAERGLRAVVLGLGTDGHIAFNQPGTTHRSRSAIVNLAQHNLSRLEGVAPACRALTMGVATILSARRIALVVSGAGKAAPLQRVLEGPEGDDVPATWLRRHEAVTIFMDDTL